jgi:hypothetical protein
MDGWHVAPDGRIGIGTETLDDGAALTVTGADNISLHAQQVRLTSTTFIPPSLVADAEIGLKTEGGSSIFLRTGTDTTEYTAVSGNAADRRGHRFRTGTVPETRMCIADDGVALDVPLKLQFCSIGNMPDPTTNGGCIVVIADRAATLELAFSDGAHWYIFSSTDFV